jgi:hypothetical protein
MVEMSRSNRQKSMLPCSPVAIFGAGLIVAQLVIFNIGVNFFHNSNDSSIDPQYHGGLPTSMHGHHQIKKRAKPINRVVSDPQADGTFNGYPIYFREKTGVYTSPHCVGENYQEDQSWMRRSCKFNFVCFDVTTKDFVVVQSQKEEKIYSHLEKRPFVDVSQSYLKRSNNHSNTVSLGGINLKWGMKESGIPRLEWFPEIRTLDPDQSLSFYELSPNVVMVPFHSMNGGNPGHLVWDDFLPTYTLLTMYQLEAESDLLMMRYVLKDGRGL